MSCRHCSAELSLELIDLGSSPPSNAYLTAEMLLAPEKTYPLRIMVCEKCWLVQTLIVYVCACMVASRPIGPKDYVRFSYHVIQWHPGQAITTPAYLRER